MNTAILLATYNSGRYLSPLLDSLMAQTYQDFRIYIHDDGSTDSTMSTVRRYMESYPGKITVLKDSRHRGPKLSFFRLLKKVEADIYFFSDDDDVWLPEKLQTLIDTMTANAAFSEKPRAVFCDMYVTDQNLNITEVSFTDALGRDGNRLLYTQLLIDNPAAGCALCINRPLRDLALSQRVRMERLPMHDHWLVLLASVFGSVEFVPECLVYYRQHGDNELGARRESRPEKILRNLRDLAGGRLAESKRAFIREPKLMAAELLRFPDLPEGVRRTLAEFVHISQRDKLSRIKFYRKHHFTRRQGNAWMMLWV